MIFFLKQLKLCLILISNLTWHVVSNLVGEEMLFYRVEQQLGIAKGTTVYFRLSIDFAMLVEAFKV